MNIFSWMLLQYRIKQRMNIGKCWFFKLNYGQGIAQTQSPHTKKLRTRVAHIWGNRRLQPKRVQWKGLDLGRSPFFIMVLPVPCKYDSYSEGRLRTKFYDDFNFPIVNFPFICSNIPVAYGAHISQLIR